MKLELKHLAPYLPYGVKIMYEYKSAFSNVQNTNKIEEMDARNIFRFYGKLPYSYVYSKPILRPLSDLTKEIEHNGQKFVPLQKLCRTIAYNEQYQKDWKFYTEVMFVSNGTQFGKYEKELVYCAWASDSIMSREFGYYSESKRFYLKNNRDKICLTDSVNQYLGLEKLFEWHFDVFGLIEKGLAIDINTLKQ